MNDLLLVLPVLDQGWTEPCIESMRREDSALGIDADEILVVDNSRRGDWAAGLGYDTYRDPENHNLGVARAWNLGARRVLGEGRDYLLLMSASMRFGPALHTTWREQMERFWGETVIECDGHSWHLIALHRRIFEGIGLFDENFHAYFEAIDFGYRMRMAGMEYGWRHCWVNALSAGVGHHAPMVDCPAPPLLKWYREKWGGDKGEETFVMPWGSKPLDYWPEVTIPDLAERCGWDDERWW